MSSQPFPKTKNINPSNIDVVFLATYIEEEFGKKIDITDDNILQALRHFNDIVRLVS